MELTMKRLLALALALTLALALPLALAETAPEAPADTVETVEEVVETVEEVVETAEETAEEVIETVEETVEEAAETAEEAPEAAEENPSGVAEEKTEPEHFFAAMNLTTLDGEPFDTSVFVGKPIFINIWATWCGPCVNEMPHLDELAREYADRITILGVHSEGMTVRDNSLVIDTEKTAAAIELRDRLGLTFPLVNPDVVMFLLMNDPQYGVNISVLPTTWLVDGDGFIRQIIPAANDKAGWAKVIDDFLLTLQEEENARTDG